MAARTVVEENRAQHEEMATASVEIAKNLRCLAERFERAKHAALEGPPIPDARLRELAEVYLDIAVRVHELVELTASISL